MRAGLIGAIGRARRGGLPLAVLAGLAAGWWCGDTIPPKSSTPSRVVATTALTSH